MIEQQSIVACGRSLTFKLIEVIMSIVEKDVKVFMEESKESCVVLHFSVNNQFFC